MIGFWALILKHFFRHNISVALLFIYHWLSGSGVFYFKGAVEDSATAEISRSQLWQWIRFKVCLMHLEKSESIITINFRIRPRLRTVLANMISLWHGNWSTNIWMISLLAYARLLEVQHLIWSALFHRNTFSSK